MSLKTWKHLREEFLEYWCYSTVINEKRLRTSSYVVGWQEIGSIFRLSIRRYLSSKICSPLTPKEGPILCLLKLENFRNMRLSPDLQIFSAPDLKPAVGKIQNRCQWKHIVIHVTIIDRMWEPPVRGFWGEWEWTFFTLPYAHLPSREIAPGLP